MADAVPPGRNKLFRAPPFRSGPETSNARSPSPGRVFNHRDGSTASRKFQGLHRDPSGEGGRSKAQGGNGGSDPHCGHHIHSGDSPEQQEEAGQSFHNGSSAGGYSASKKKKVSASGFAQVRCHSPNLRVRGSPHSLPLPIQGARGRMRGPEWVGLSEAGRFVWAGPYSHTSFVDAVYGASETSPHPLTLATWGLIK